MADSASSPATLQPPNPQHSEPGPPNQPDPVPPPSQSQSQSQSSTPSSTPLAANPNSNPPLAPAPSLPPPPTLLYSAGAPPHVSGVLPPSTPSFRPLGVPQFSPLPNPAGAYQNPTVPPPGVTGAGAPVPLPVPQMQPMMSYQVPPGPSTNPALRPFAPIPNGYAAPPQGTVTPAVSY